MKTSGIFYFWQLQEILPFRISLQSPITSWVQQSSAPAASLMTRSKIYESSLTVAPASRAPLKCFSAQGFDLALIERAKQMN